MPWAGQPCEAAPNARGRKSQSIRMGNQNRVITEKTMMTIRTVGTSFIIR